MEIEMDMDIDMDIGDEAYWECTNEALVVVLATDSKQNAVRSNNEQSNYNST